MQRSHLIRLRCALRMATLSDLDCTPRILIASFALIGDSKPVMQCVCGGERGGQVAVQRRTLNAFGEGAANASEAFEQGSGGKCGGG